MKTSLVTKTLTFNRVSKLVLSLKHTLKDKKPLKKSQCLYIVNIDSWLFVNLKTPTATRLKVFF